MMRMSFNKSKMANEDTPASLFEADAQLAESDPTDN